MLKYILEKEMACPCCGENRTNKDFLHKLNVARAIAGVPFVINSGWRCEKHNKKVRGSLTSAHLVGLAADIACPDSNMRYHIVMGLLLAGFKRIGMGKDFIHVDDAACEIKPDEVIWLYYKE